MERAERKNGVSARQLLVPTLKVGALTGMAGLLTGSIAGLLRNSKTPTLFAVASGIQCFTLGSMFWATRTLLLSPPLLPTLRSWPQTPLSTLKNTTTIETTPKDRIRASTLSGAITGLTTAALFRGRGNLLPGMLVFLALGHMGQKGYEWLDEEHSLKVQREEESGRGRGRGEDGGGWLDWVGGLRWSPVRRIADEEFVSMLEERVVRVEAEISIVEEEVERLRGQDVKGGKRGGEGGEVEGR